MNWIIVSAVVAVVILLLFFIYKKNKRDEQDLENKIKNDYHKPPHDKSDIEPEETPH